MDIITEAREYLECHPLLSDGTYFAEHNNLIKTLLTKLEEKEREVDACNDLLRGERNAVKEVSDMGVILHTENKELKAENERLRQDK